MIVTSTDSMPASSTPSRAVAAAEADIEQTRQQLDRALAAIRRDLGVPLAAIAGMAALLDQAGDAPQIREFLRHNAMPLGLIALGMLWLGVQNRKSLGNLGSAYANEVLRRARTLGKTATAAAISAALEEIARSSASVETKQGKLAAAAVPELPERRP
jgi:signal transduction histidine kinase